MSVDFNFTLQDLANNDPTAAHPIVVAQNKWNATGKPYSTTRSAVGFTSSANQSTLSISEILQNGTMFGDVGNALQNIETTIESVLSNLVSIGNFGVGAVDSFANGISALIPDDLRGALNFADALSGQDLSTFFSGKASSAHSTGTVDIGKKIVANTKNIAFTSGPVGNATKQSLTNGQFSYNLCQTIDILSQRFALTLGDGIDGGMTDSPLHLDGRAIDIVQITDTKSNQTVVVGESNNTVLMAVLSMLNTMPWIIQSGEIISPIDPQFGPAFYTNPQHQGANSVLHIGCKVPGASPTQTSTAPGLPIDLGASASGAAAGSTDGPGSVVGTTAVTGTVGIIWPFPTKDPSQFRRIDQGWDLQVAVGTPLYAIASGTISYSHNAPGFGDPYPVLTFDHPQAGNPACYYGHNHPEVAEGAHVNQGDIICHALQVPGGNASSYPGWLEIGWWNSGPTGNGQLMHDTLIGAPVLAQPGINVNTSTGQGL